MRIRPVVSLRCVALLLFDGGDVGAKPVFLVKLAYSFSSPSSSSSPPTPLVSPIFLSPPPTPAPPLFPWFSSPLLSSFLSLPLPLLFSIGHFLREFRFTSEVPIWLDYQGKHVVIEQVSGQSSLLSLALIDAFSRSHTETVEVHLELASAAWVMSSSTLNN